MSKDTQPDLSGYREAGYFSEAGHLRPEYMDRWADEHARNFGEAKPPLTKHQMRAFFNEIKRLQTIHRAMAQRGKTNFEPLRNRLLGLKAQAHLRCQRGSIPESFKNFLETNVDKAVAGGEKAFGAFAQHFEAVAAYCEGRLRKD